jgi:hypothetical protein
MYFIDAEADSHPFKRSLVTRISFAAWPHDIYLRFG